MTKLVFWNVGNKNKKGCFTIVCSFQLIDLRSGRIPTVVVVAVVVVIGIVIVVVVGEVLVSPGLNVVVVKPERSQIHGRSWSDLSWENSKNESKDPNETTIGPLFVKTKTIFVKPHFSLKNQCCRCSWLINLRSFRKGFILFISSKLSLPLSAFG